MIKISTLKLLDLLLKEKYSKFDKLNDNISLEEELEPKKETIQNILSYASSVRSIKTKSIDNIIISLN
tara:strand:- start:1551 stop:1754 length:204 start_codon:yes stop_codon:yes gene_type:complete